MTEDLDKELEGLMGDSDADMGDLDLGDLDAGGEDTESAEEGGGSFDADLAALMDDDAPSGGGDDSMDGEGMDIAMGGDDDEDSRARAAAAYAASLSASEATNLEFLLDIKLNVTFEVGRAKMVISDLLTLGQGSVVELHRLVGDELDLLINGRLVAKGEVIVINEKFGCKITEIIPPEDRVRHLGTL